MERQAKDGTFYQKVGNDEWTPVTRQALDGTIYKKVGSDQWAPLHGADMPEESPSPSKDGDSILGIPKTTIEGTLNALPFAGALAGGTVGMAAGPLGAVGGAGLGGAGGEALANGIRAALNLDSAPQTRAEVYTRPAKEGLLSAAGEGAGQALAAVPGVLRKAPSALKKGYSAASDFLSGADDTAQLARFEDVGFAPKEKPNAYQIEQAAKRLGAKATPGMLSANKNIQNMENVLSQTPTIAGERVRASYDPIYKSLRDASEDLAGSPNLSPFEAGQQFKAGLKQKIAEKVQPLSSRFEEIRASAQNIKPEPASLNRAADRLLKQDLAEFANLPQGQAIQKYAGMIREAKSLDSLKQLRSSVGDEMGQALDAGNGQLAMALGKVKGAIQRAERREILKTAIARAQEVVPDRAAGGQFLSGPAKQAMAQKEGAAIAKDMIGEIKAVNKGWRSLMTELEAVANAGGINKIASPKHLSRIIDDMPAEKIAERFFNTKNYAGLRDVKQYLPEEFDILRQHKLGTIAEKSLTRGEPDPVKLVRNLRSIGPEARELLFGKDGERILRDIETVVNSMPVKVGSSDTPRGMAWFSLLKPSRWAGEAQSAYNYMLLKGRTVKNLPSQPSAGTLPRALGYAGAGVMANDLDRGENRWAKAGIQKLNAHAGYDVLDVNFDMASANPKLKSLLIQASDLKPGTPAMGNILQRIQTEYSKPNE